VFTKRDRNAAIILVCIISIVMLLPYLLPAKKLETNTDKELQAELDQYRNEYPQSNSQSYFSPIRDTTITDTI
jgi:hypothetical protein